MKQLTNIEDLVYGNLDAESIMYIGVKNDFTKLIDDFKDYPYPTIDVSKQEIERLIQEQKEYMLRSGKGKYQALLNLDKNIKRLTESGIMEDTSEFWQDADVDIQKVFKKQFRKIGIPYTRKFAQHLEEAQEELGALVMQLKQYYNRPRPYQIAYYTNQKLHPFMTTSGNTPAYPSGHACQGRFLMKIAAYHYPHKEMALKRLADRIAHSRVYMGLHYASDNKFGIMIADRLATYPSIKKKYFRR